MAIFVVYARRTPEVLGRVLSLFHKRAINIERLTAEPGKTPHVLRVTIQIQSDSEQTQRIEANLYKLIDVLMVEISDGMQRDEIHDAQPPSA